MAKRWPTGAEVRWVPLQRGRMLYDGSRAGNATANWFDPYWWAERTTVRHSSEGRGAVLFIDTPDRPLVLRHYRRGGLIAQLSRDRYLWCGETATRSVSEWMLLYHMRRAGLPVPTPIAARYVRHGLTYSADLILERIEHTHSLAQYLREEALPLEGWTAIGRCLRLFHLAGVCHADLNAHNVLIGPQQRIWLIDFDRGSLRRPGFWCDANLVRLRRSVEKVADTLPQDRFCETDWLALVNGYFDSSALVTG
jgi:3-deoxy-D-manno-octulosonic acid kinase